MTQEEKNLLLKDLCARLPYGVLIQYHTDYDWTPVKMRNISAYGLFNDGYRFENCKPYLRPLSSMTDEEENEYRAINCYEGLFPHNEDALDYILEHHFDYRGLIEKGLAIAVTEENNPYKD